MNSKYTTPKLEVAIKYREDRNKFINENYCPRIPTEENRWTQEELDTLRDKVNKDRPLCKFGASCDRLQCAYSHPLIRTGICKDFRWCEGDKCVLIHPTQKFCDYIDYTEPVLLLEQGFVLS